MALLLIMGVNHTHTDPVKGERGCYKLGDIVEVLDDSAHDGNIVANPIMPPFYMIRVTGVTKAQVLRAMDRHLDENFNVLRRRKFWLNQASIPAGARNQLIANRYLEVTLTQARNYVRNRLDGTAL
jgi:hypothetical protein